MGVLEYLKTHDNFYRSGHKLAKYSTLPFNKNISIFVAQFDLNHSSIWGPSPITTKGGL